jgi:lysyl-tRNA synthetase class 2
LRIAPELYLKRLLVGGFERVFEINRNFRNEGLSTRHNPEFTMLEFYQAYARVDDMISLTEKLLKEVVFALHGKYDVVYAGNHIDFSKPFTVWSMKHAIAVYHPHLDLDDPIAVRAFLTQEGYDSGGETLEHMLLEIFEQSIESRLIQPTFITEYPTVISPLARHNDANPAIVDRFEMFIGGYEIANAFSELNDPLEQAKRFEAQMVAKAQGADETMPFDADYINALSYGMPPAAGEGIGIDRLAMILTDASSIKDVILFPHMRPQEESGQELS